jgi:hypothetical protein
LVHNELLTISAQELGILHFKRKKLGQLDVWSPLLWPKHLLNSHSHLNCPPGLSHCFVSSEFLLLKKKKKRDNESPEIQGKIYWSHWGEKESWIMQVIQERVSAVETWSSPLRPLTMTRFPQEKLKSCFCHSHPASGATRHSFNSELKETSCV